MRQFRLLLMLFQIIFVILSPKHDNLKQGKFTLFCDNMEQRESSERKGRSGIYAGTDDNLSKQE